MFKNYLMHPEGNPEGYWFKKKLYSLGWIPASWQGWFIMGAYFTIVILVISSALIIDGASSLRQATVIYIIPVILATIAIIHTCHKKGEDTEGEI